MESVSIAIWKYECDSISIHIVGCWVMLTQTIILLVSFCVFSSRSFRCCMCSQSAEQFMCRVNNRRANGPAAYGAHHVKSFRSYCKSTNSISTDFHILVLPLQPPLYSPTCVILLPLWWHLQVIQQYFITPTTAQLWRGISKNAKGKGHNRKCTL